MKDEKRDASLERLLQSSLRKSPQDLPDCPDAETLAAWFDDRLMTRQRSRIDEHLAGCSRCQAHVAALARSGHVQPVSSQRPKAWLRWQWMVPVAAGATALVVWAVTRPDVRRTARQEPASQSAAAIERPAPPLERPAPAAAPPAATANAPERQFDALTQQKAPAPAETRDRATAQPPSSPAPVRAETASENARTAASKIARADRAADAPAESQKLEARSARVSGAAAPALAVHEIPTSDPAVRWRIRGADIERTVDAGATWTKQPTGTSAPLTAGAAASHDVCWVVGRQGTVLRSTDGRTWRAVPFPEAVDLVQVEATDGARATVMTGDARRFTTDDGGATWRPEGLQDF